jgi:hypothetical protein
VKVHLDEDLSPSIAFLLRQRGMDATSAHEVGNSQLGDRAELEYATREGRAVITRNVVDFLRLARDAVATNTHHEGIVLVPSSFRGDEYQAIADAIVKDLKPYPLGLAGVVLYLKHGQKRGVGSRRISDP